MLTIRELNAFTDDQTVSDNISQVWTLIGEHCVAAWRTRPSPRAAPLAAAVALPLHRRSCWRFL